MYMIINLPYKILVEKSVDEKIKDILMQMHLGKNCAVICDEHVQKLIGDKIDEILSKSFNTEIINPISIEKTYLEELSERIKLFDFTIGLGGGRSIDATKYSSFLAAKPWIAFPTILSHDGVVSSRAVVNSNGDKVSVAAIEPIAIIGDLNTIKKAPYRWLAAGAGDLISNISAVEDWKIAAKAGKEEYHTLMAELALLSAKGVINHVTDIREKTYHGLEILLWSLICSGFAMNIYGSSRPCSGSEHNFSHALEKLSTEKNVHAGLHGEQCGLGSIISSYLQGNNWREIRNILKSIGCPTTASEIGIDKDLLIEALVLAPNVRDRYTVLNEHKIDRNKAEKILEKVEII